MTLCNSTEVNLVSKQIYIIFIPKLDGYQAGPLSLKVRPNSEPCGALACARSIGPL